MVHPMYYLWQHTDEDGDRIRLVQRGHDYQLHIPPSGQEQGRAVDIPMEDLWRLGDVIERERTS